MKIFRTLLIIGVGAFFLPSPPGHENADVANTPAMMSAAFNAAGDVGSFCQRQPEVCRVAASMGSTLEAKLRYSIKLLYEWANEPASASAKPRSASAWFISPAAAEEMLVAEGEAVSQSTLKIEDLLPEWRDPYAIKRS